MDRFLDFAFECQKHALKAAAGTASAADAGMLIKAAYEESVVLLKNADKTLPLKAGIKVAVIGSLADLPEDAAQLSFAQTLPKENAGLGFEYMGYAKGYSLSGERSDDLISEAHTLACSAEAVLLFLGFDKETEAKVSDTHCLKLPANQLALLDKLTKSGRKIIAVISGGLAPDTSFSEDCSALILLPLGGKYSGDTLFKLLSGKLNPSGKLTCTLYDNTDEFFIEFKESKNFGNTKVGPFFGYRNCDTAGIKVQYPFGHGLSYTTFSYSGLTASASGIKFKVKNTGLKPGCEIAQVYIGKSNSKVLRPLKELKGFAKVYLEPGESKVVDISLDYSIFEFCDPADGQRKVEHGKYIAYVGASVSDIRLSKTFEVLGQELLGEKEDLSDYIHTMTNIVNGRYTLQAPKKRRKKAPKADIIARLMIAAVVFYDILYAISIIYESNTPTAVIIFIISNFILLPLSIGKLVRSSKKRKMEAGEPVMEDVREEETVLSGKTKLEKLFLEEFAENTHSGGQTKLSSNHKEDVSKYTNKSMTVKTAAALITAYMGERGFMINPSTSRDILAAMFASRMIILTGNDQVVSEDFLRNLCSLFSTPVFIDDIDINWQGSDRPLFFRDEGGKHIKAVAADAISAACGDKHLIHIAALRGLKFPQCNKFLIPFVNYAAKPGKGYNALLDGQTACGDNTLPGDQAACGEGFTIPPNLWVFLMLPKDGTLYSIPPHIAESSLIVDVKLGSGQEKPDGPTKQRLNYHQFMQLGYDSEKAYALSEDTWRKLDNLEEFVDGHTPPYRIGNKQWRRLERFTSVYLALGSTEAKALDSAIAAKLMPEIAARISRNPQDSNNFPFTLEKILGEENADGSLAVLRHFSRASLGQSGDSEA